VRGANALWKSINCSSYTSFCTSFCTLAEDFSSSALLFTAASASHFDANKLLIRLPNVLILESLGFMWMVSNYMLSSRTLRLISGSEDCKVRGCLDVVSEAAEGVVGALASVAAGAKAENLKSG